MRTTLEIDDDLIALAKEVSRARKQSIGHTISEWVREGLQPRGAPDIEMRQGIPVIVHRRGAEQVTGDLVRTLAEE